MTDYTDFLRQKIKMANFKGFSVETVATLKGQRMGLCSLLRECLPMVDQLFQFPGTDATDAHLNGLRARIEAALKAIAEEQVRGVDSLDALAAGQATAAQAMVPAGFVAKVEAAHRAVHPTAKAALIEEAAELLVAAPAQPAAQQGVAYAALPEFESLDDDLIDAACDAGGLYRVDLMRAWHVLRGLHAAQEGK